MLKTEAIKPHIGTIVRIDAETICGSDEIAHQCVDLLEERGVLVFPQINLTDVQQLVLTERMGARAEYTAKAPGTDADEDGVYTIALDPTINKAPEYILGTFFWHMDGVTADIPPPRATILTGRTLSDTGGQTQFASTYAAYEGLSGAVKAEIADLRVIHSAFASMAMTNEWDMSSDLSAHMMGYQTEHPLVWTHQSGRKSLLLGSHADRVVDMPLAHGRALLTRLVEWAGQPDYTYSHDWQKGDLVIWDNCGTLHRVIPYDEQSGRKMHRTTLAGTELVR